MPEPPHTTSRGNQHWLIRKDGPCEVRPSLLVTQYVYYYKGVVDRGVWFRHWIGDRISYDFRQDNASPYKTVTFGGARHA